MKDIKYTESQKFDKKALECGFELKNVLEVSTTMDLLTPEFKIVNSQS